MASAGSGHVCVAAAQLRRLDAAGMAAALSAVSPGLRAQCVRAAGLRARLDAPTERTAKLLVARLRSLDGESAHNVVVALTDPARAALLEVIGDDEERVAEDVAKGLDGPLSRWPRPVLAALFALLGELGAYAPTTRDALLALVADGREENTPQPGDEAPTPRSTGDLAESPPALPTSPAGESSSATGVSPLDAVVRDALLSGQAATSGSQLDRAVAAIDELVSLDGRRNGSWRLVGLAEGLSERWAMPCGSPTADATYHRFAGVVEALVHRGSAIELARLTRARRAETERLITDPSERQLAEPVINALLETESATVRRLLVMVPEPFPGWRVLIECLRRSAEGLASCDLAAAAGLLRAGDEMLTAWTAVVGASEQAEVERAAAELAVGRVGLQRRAGDFRGARSVLDRIDLRCLSSASRSQLLDEAALVACELSSLDAVDFPSTGGERAAARQRFGRAAPAIEAALNGGSGLVAPVLGAALAVSTGEIRHAVADLRVACAALSEDPIGNDRLRATLEFQLGLNELCLLETGTEEAAARRIDAALGAGHAPGIADLSTVAVALDAHSSPRAVAAVNRVLELAPGDRDAIGLLTEMARRDVEGAPALAAARGGDERLPRKLRFELLDAALTAATTGEPGDAGLDVERLADELERLVAKAADADLDRRWAIRLAADDSLRSALGADALDLVRLHVLRRSGLIDDAAAAARGLFHRSLGGHVEGVDAVDLLELLGQLAPDAHELEGLQRLLPSDANEVSAQHVGAGSPPQRVAPTLVLFVGGNETQVRARPAVERAVADRYGGAVTVEWFATGWGSNWAPAAAEIEARYAEASVVVLMTFIRTMLGRRLRRTAGEAGLPWVACTGHGAKSIERAIDRGVALSHLVRSSSPRA